MTFKIKKSFVRSNLHDFEVQVAAHANEVKDWLAREQRVAEDAKNPNVSDIERWVSCPAPVAPNSYVASAVNEDGVADYQIVPDDPTPEDILPIKRAMLVRAVNEAAAIAAEKVSPVNKRPLRQMRMSDLRAAEEIRKQEFLAAEHSKAIEVHRAYDDSVMAIVNEEVNPIIKLGIKVGFVNDERISRIAAIERPASPTLDATAEVVAQRSAEDAAFVSEVEDSDARMQKISRASAQAMHDIEDLTVDNVDEFQIPDFSILQ